MYLGVNSGTSADAIDCVLVDITDNSIQVIGSSELKIHSGLKDKIYEHVEKKKLCVQEYQELQWQITEQYILAIKHVLEKYNLKNSDIKAIGAHGQTIHHKPSSRYPYTLQCVNAAKIAQAFKITTVDNFRGVDIALGGQGAPLTPAFCHYLVKIQGIEEAVFLNLGGIANVTYISSSQGVLGWDTGPANALMDAWIHVCLNKEYDHLGLWADSGEVIPALLEEFLSDPYFAMKPPKSTGRDYFSLAWQERYTQNKAYSSEDIQATLRELTVKTINDAFEKNIGRLDHLTCYLHGKGVYNESVVNKLREALPCKIKTSNDIGIPIEDFEGALFAWLAYCYHTRKPLDLTKITGASKPAILGCAYI